MNKFNKLKFLTIIILSILTTFLMYYEKQGWGYFAFVIVILSLTHQSEETNEK